MKWFLIIKNITELKNKWFSQLSALTHHRAIERRTYLAYAYSFAIEKAYAQQMENTEMLKS